jgi:hypothetical protein
MLVIFLFEKNHFLPKYLNSFQKVIEDKSSLFSRHQEPQSLTIMPPMCKFCPNIFLLKDLEDFICPKCTHQYTPMQAPRSNSERIVQETGTMLENEAMKIDFECISLQILDNNLLFWV